LAKSCDVFLTSYLPSRRRRFGIDVDDVRAVNPGIIYVRGSGYGPRGDDADRPGYDGVSYWSRGGVGRAISGEDAAPARQRPAFGDLLGGMTIAGGIAAALYKRKVTGAASVVDVSLLGLAAYNLTPDVMASRLYETQPIPTFTHADSPNPLVGDYRTKDDRYITLMMLQPDRFFAEVMNLIGLPDVLGDSRFADAASRFGNRAELIRMMDEVFAQRTLAEWRRILAPLSGAWSAAQAPGELCDDPAVIANGYIPTLTAMSGSPYELPVNPVQFDEEHVVPAGAPEHGQHTEEVLLDAGMDWNQIQQYKQEGAIL
jgi:crotonobetainyl-CoA:carnitine CoA-transferase CaiB-like acyl-CoA transferase